jgi:heptosyltransferase-2
MGDARSDVKSIAVRFPNWIGDAVLAGPVLRSLRQGYPEARIDVVAVKRVAPVIEADPNIDNLIVIPDRLDIPVGHIKAARMVRAGRYDMGLILPDSFGSALLFSMAGVRRRIGYAAEMRGPLLTLAVEHETDPRSEHLIYSYLKLAREAGGESVPAEPSHTTLPEEDGWAEGLLDGLGIESNSPLIGVVPGATYGPAKRWPPDRFRQIIKVVAADKWTVLILGGPDDADTVKAIFPDGEQPENVHNLVGRTTIRQTAALMQRLDVVLCNDTGPMHLAAAVGTAVVGLFGSTNPVWTGPLGPRQFAIRGSVPCSPCYLRDCPYDLECFKMIDPEMVLVALRNSIDERDE